MAPETPHHLGGSLLLAVALASTAGFVDAFIYVRVTPVFVANMSGNLVHVGVAFGGHDWRAASSAAVAICGFVLGVALATARVDVSVRRGRAPLAADLLGAETFLLLLLTTILWVEGVGYSASAGPVDFAVVVVGATAMGIQAVALRRVGSVAVSTTFGTGAVVRLGEKAALALRRTDRPGGHRRRLTIAVLGAVLVSYVAGAYVGSSVGRSPLVLLIPSMVSLLATFSERRRRLPADRPQGFLRSRRAAVGPRSSVSKTVVDPEQECHSTLTPSVSQVDTVVNERGGGSDG